jgi:hypothetical protein
MARFQIRLGDSGDVPVSYQSSVVQQFVTIRDTGTMTVTTSNCSVYAFLNGVEYTKVPRNSTLIFPVQGGMTLDVQVAGTTVEQPNGNIHYSLDP